MTLAYLSSSALYSVGRVGELVPPVAAGGGLGLVGASTGVDEDSDHHRDLASIDQVVHHVLSPHVPLRVLERLPVLVDHQGGRDARIILRRDVGPIGMLGPGISLAGQDERTSDLPLRDAFLRLRIRTQPILRVRIRPRAGLLSHHIRQEHHRQARATEPDRRNDRVSHQTTPRSEEMQESPRSTLKSPP